MMFVSCLIVLVTSVTAEKVIFELKTSFNDLDLFQEFALGSPSTYIRPDKCAQHCGRNPQCSMFSFNQAAETCQLYGDVVCPDVSLGAHLSGERYYTYKADWCPLEKGFFMIRPVNMCVKLSTEMETYDNAGLKCQEHGARLIVLEDEAKATAVINFLAEIGLSDTWILMGADDRNTEGVFVWTDGSQMIRQWWYPGEPNDPGGEDCAFVWNGELFDFKCEDNVIYICEIPN